METNKNYLQLRQECRLNALKLLNRLLLGSDQSPRLLLAIAELLRVMEIK